jgi:hypothetical protein
MLRMYCDPSAVHSSHPRCIANNRCATTTQAPSDKAALRQASHAAACASPSVESVVGVRQQRNHSVCAQVVALHGVGVAAAQMQCDLGPKQPDVCALQCARRDQRAPDLARRYRCQQRLAVGKLLAGALQPASPAAPPRARRRLVVACVVLGLSSALISVTPARATSASN